MRSTTQDKSTVTEGLVLYLDAANPNSYPGSGNTWFDIANIDNQNNLILTDAPTYTTNNGNPCFSFNGTTNYGTFINNPIYTLYRFNQINQKWTIDCWFKASTKSSSAQTFLGDYGTGIGFGIYFEFRPTQVWPLMWTDGSKYLYGANQVTDGTDKHITFTFDGSSTSRQQRIYVNGILNSSRTDNLSNQTWPTLGNQLYLGGNNTGKFQGIIYNMKMYSRALSASEVAQNYNALKGRFGLQ